MKNLAKALLSFWFALGVGWAQQPRINPNGVVNGASYSSEIAPGGVFVITGADLSDADFHQGGLPLPTLLAGSKITFTAVTGGAATDAYIIHAFRRDGVNQLAGLLPSTVQPGDYLVRVTYNGVESAAALATVVSRKFGVFTVPGTGEGRAVVQNYISPTRLDLNRFTTASGTFSPAQPGQTLIAWGTGLGGITKADSLAPGAIDFRSQADIRVIVGGVEIQPLYAGRAPELPGVDQVNFQLPAGMRTGCLVRFQVRVEGRLSNAATIAIAPPDSDSCVHQQLSRDSLRKLDAGGSVVMASFVLGGAGFKATWFGSTVLDGIEEWATGSFARYTADQLGEVPGLVTEVGSCRLFRLSGEWYDLDGRGGTTLDAGDRLKLGDFTLARGAGGVYSYTQQNAGVPGAPAGPGVRERQTYNLTGEGGAGIGSFSASLEVAPLQVMVPVAELLNTRGIDRSRGETINWTGGTGLVSILGYSPALARGPNAFVCTTTADRKTFTVPAEVLLQFPPRTEGRFLLLSIGTPAPGSSPFRAPLANGGEIDGGILVSALGWLWLETAYY
jgi:uncharacterized protein (TIGR03437 family)